MAQGVSDFSTEDLAAAVVLSGRAWLPNSRVHAAFGEAYRELSAHEDAVKCCSRAPRPLGRGCNCAMSS